MALGAGIAQGGVGRGLADAATAAAAERNGQFQQLNFLATYKARPTAASRRRRRRPPSPIRVSCERWPRNISRAGSEKAAPSRLASTFGSAITNGINNHTRLQPCELHRLGHPGYRVCWKPLSPGGG